MSAECSVSFVWIPAGLGSREWSLAVKRPLWPAEKRQRRRLHKHETLQGYCVCLQRPISNHSLWQWWQKQSILLTQYLLNSLSWLVNYSILRSWIGDHSNTGWRWICRNNNNNINLFSIRKHQHDFSDGSFHLFQFTVWGWAEPTSPSHSQLVKYRLDSSISFQLAIINNVVRHISHAEFLTVLNAVLNFSNSYTLHNLHYILYIT